MDNKHVRQSYTGTTVTRWSDIKDGDLTWLWENKIAIGDVTLISGLGGVGKSYFTCFLASHVTAGKPWPDDTPCERGSVVFFPVEGRTDIFKKRLQENGVDLEKCVHWDNTSLPEEVNLRQLAAIEQAIDDAEKATGLPVRLLAIDPVGNFFKGSNNDFGVREVLMPLEKMAARRGIAIVLIAHHGKAKHSVVQHQALGSVAWVNASRAHWQISRDQQDTKLRYFAPTAKTNHCVDPTALSFRIIGGKVLVEETDIDLLADDLVIEAKRGRPPKKRAEVMLWLEELLAGGKKPFREIRAAWEEAGFSEDTVENAAEELGLEKRAQGFGKEKIGYWELPAD
jgi:hypothetical protein